MTNTTALSDNKLKKFSRLHNKKFRIKEGLFLIEGRRATEQLLRNPGIDTIAVVIQSGALQPTGIGDRPETELLEADAVSFSRLSDTENSQGVLAIARIPSPIDTETLSPDKHPIILALDEIADPGNLGTIYRTAAWFGVSAMLPGTGCVDLFNPKTVRSTAGSIGAVPYAEATLDELLPKLGKAGWELLCLDAAPDATPLFDLEIAGPVVITTGNEAHGISEKIRLHCKPVILPGNAENVESLNASVACSIAIAHVGNKLRQKTS